MLLECTPRYGLCAADLQSYAGYALHLNNQGNHVIMQANGLANVGIGVTDGVPAANLEIHAGTGLTSVFSQSSDVVAHGMTTPFGATDVFGRAAIYDTANGGWLLRGASDEAATPGLVIEGDIGVADPTDTTPGVMITAGKKSGVTVAALGAAETVLQIVNSGVLTTTLGNGDTGFGVNPPTAKVDVAGTFKVSGTSAFGGGAAITAIYSAAAALNYPAIDALSATNLTITVTGAGTNSAVSLGTDAVALETGISFFGWVSATNTVTVKAINFSNASVDPAIRSVRATVFQY